MNYQCSRCGISWEGPIQECPKCEQTDTVSVQTEEKAKDACKSGTWEHDEGFKTEEKPATVLDPHRERLGRRVREVWIAWAKRQPNPKPSWLVPYDELSEADKEADRCIGCAIWGDCIEAHSEAIASHAVKHLQPATVPLAVAEGSPFVRWVREDRLKCWELIVANPRRSAATVWDNGTWHTWDRDGVGGENSSEETVDRAKVEASASAIVQGFI